MQLLNGMTSAPPAVRLTGWILATHAAPDSLRCAPADGDLEHATGAPPDVIARSLAALLDAGLIEAAEPGWILRFPPPDDALAALSPGRRK
jgi:hypothetical protein